MELLPILAIFVIFWLLIIQPARRRQKQVDRMQTSVTVGAQVATSGGIFGTVVSDDGEDRLGLEIAPGIVVSIARRAVAGVVTEAEDETAAERSDDAAESDESDEAGPRPDEAGDDSQA